MRLRYDQNIPSLPSLLFSFLYLKKYLSIAYVCVICLDSRMPQCGCGVEVGGWAS